MNDLEVVELSENDEGDDCILESVIYEDAKLNKTVNDNPLLTEFIDICLKLENSVEMIKVINKTLLKIYRKTDARFTQSQVFQKALRRANNLLKTEPSYKYSHIKDLCNILKSNNTKKRVPIITLTNNIKENKLPSLSCKRKSESDGNSKRQKTDIIDLDLSEDISINGIDNEEEGKLGADDSLVDREKENSNISSPIKNTDENTLLVPHKELEYDINVHTDVNEKIIKIEEEIAYCKKVVARLDEAEVCFDTKYSPYLKCERFKARIVSLYKELCKLTGEMPVRTSKVHLKVRDGHPAGAVLRLERFLNKNVGSDGNPMFPNFRDVVKCVLKANEKDNLGWSKQQIMKEASALFTHCGRALQKRRQKREWRDLLSKVKLEQCDDPADNDPELLARLEANKLAAVKKEKEILERYTKMQNMPPQRDKVVSNQVDDDECSHNSDSDFVSSSDESENKDSPNNRLIQTASTSNETPQENDNVKNVITEGNTEAETNDLSMVKVKKEPELSLNEILEELGENHTTVVEIEDPFVIIEISDSSSDESE
ncbi:uncharacterized protein LOC124536946 isoform X1 [Vanessa cardui]|uniref:uncharacterized protein LOC124536946 isoform X1 n=1 Tax=Vanessa cardui TaxID=171605 RepID=UPI001F13CCE4|nr:uncharacterized protein LOC124536946 isoform X1 [Vanessa cardui]